MLPTENLPNRGFGSQDEIIDGLVERQLRTDWLGYASIFSDPERLSTFIKDNLLFVIHPGFRDYWPRMRDYMENFDGYEIYRENLRSTLQSAINYGRTVLLFVPVRYKRETLDFVGLSEDFGIPENLFLVPTQYNMVLLDASVGVETGGFYRQLSQHVTVAEICGEWSEACIADVEKGAESVGIKISRVKDSIFPLPRVCSGG